MRRPAKPALCIWLMVACLLVCVTACTAPVSPVSVTPSPTPPGYTLAHGGSCVKLGSHPQPPYANVRVSADSYLAHSEPMLAENPRDPLNLVGGSKFFTDPRHYRFQIGSYASFDGGCTWQDGGVFPGFQSTELTSDITFAFGTQNDVYALVLNTSTTGPGESGVSVLVSRNGGRTFGQPVNVFDDPSGKTFSDKPWIVVDTTNGPHHGDVYVVWSYDHGGSCGDGNFCSQGLAFSRSSDGGKSFSPMRLVEGHASFCTNPARGRPVDATSCDGVLGTIPVVLPNGTLAVAFMYVDVMSGGKIPTRLAMVSSPDGGTNWTNPVLIASIHDIDGTFPPETYRNLSLPAFACDPRTGQLYLTWSDKGPKDADILFSTSTDGGQNWNLVPVRVNDDEQDNGANQFQPQLAVAPDGVVSVIFFDTRLDPLHRLIDVYLAQSTNHGVSFLKNRRVTTQSWDPTVDAPVDENGLHFIGDYQGLTADNTFVHPFWNETRTGSQEIFTAALPSALPG